MQRKQILQDRTGRRQECSEANSCKASHPACFCLGDDNTIHHIQEVIKI